MRGASQGWGARGGGKERNSKIKGVSNTQAQNIYMYVQLGENSHCGILCYSYTTVTRDLSWKTTRSRGRSPRERCGFPR